MCEYALSNVIFGKLCSSWQDLDWHSASRGPSAIVQFLILPDWVWCHSIVPENSEEVEILVIWSTLLSRPHDVGLKCPSVRPAVRPSVHKNFFSISMKFGNWHVGRGRWVMHDGMQYDPIQGQGQGHEPLKVGNPSIFKSYRLRHLQWELATDHWCLNWGTISNFDIWPSFCVTWL